MQQNWAQINDVNFLAAGANLPILGTTGSGIYSGQLGALTSIMTGENATRLLIHEVSKVPGNAVADSTRNFFGTNFDDLTLYQDEFDKYAFTTVNTTSEPSEAQMFELCSTFKEERLCCRFNIEATANDIPNGIVRLR